METLINKIRNIKCVPKSKMRSVSRILIFLKIGFLSGQVNIIFAKTNFGNDYGTVVTVTGKFMTAAKAGNLTFSFETLHMKK